MLRFILVTVIFFLHACSNEVEIKDGKVETVDKQTVTDTLYYSGTIKPLASNIVTSMTEGVVIGMPKKFGDKVKKDDTLFVISSTKFLSDYKSALLQYVKTKNEFNNNQAQLKEADFLHKHELISDDDYKMKKSSFYAAQLALLQARDALDVLLKQMDLKESAVDSLTIENIDKITKAMHLKKRSENIRIVSPISGYMLSAGKSEDDGKKYSVGDAVKQGDVLAVIGNMNGISIDVRVNELVVNKIKPGQPVSITGIAFPEYQLQGKIVRVDHQAESSNNGLPTFAVHIAVPALSSKQLKKIHVGMSAKVQIDIHEKETIMVPVSAIHEKSGKTYVTKYDISTKQKLDVAVTTGKTSQTSVSILSGLQSGDNIVIPT